MLTNIWIYQGQQVEVLSEGDDEDMEYEDESILLDESDLQGEEGASGNIMAVQVCVRNRSVHIVLIWILFIFLQVFYHIIYYNFIS